MSAERHAVSDMAPSVASLVDFHIGRSADGTPEIAMRFNDSAEARAWAVWLFGRTEDAVNNL